MKFEDLRSPLQLLSKFLVGAEVPKWLLEYDSWWRKEGHKISRAVDRGGTPWLRMFDPQGMRVDEILYPAEYWRMLKRGYRCGILWRSFAENSLLPAYLGIYITSFYDPGLSCPYTVSLSTALPVSKYGDASLQKRFLEPMLRRDDDVWQGATWMTEIKGGSDLGATVETTARRDGDHWLLTGDKYFASNAGAEVAVVAARPEGAPPGVRGLALYLVPRRKQNGALNYFIRRMKDKIATRSVPTGEVELRDSEGWLLGKAEHGIYLILEVLNCSRVANAVGSVALAQRAMADAFDFAQQRMVFGKPLIEQPLMKRQFGDRLAALELASRLAWEAVALLNRVWREMPPYSEQFHLFRLVTHLAKYWTAELAVDTAKWAMEVCGGLGTLAEYGMERWLREAMILAIWEGPAHRQILDGLEVMERKRAHELLFTYLPSGTPGGQEMRVRIEQHLKLPQFEKEAGAETLFRQLAVFTARALEERP